MEEVSLMISIPKRKDLPLCRVYLADRFRQCKGNLGLRRYLLLFETHSGRSLRRVDSPWHSRLCSLARSAGGMEQQRSRPHQNHISQAYRCAATRAKKCTCRQRIRRCQGESGQRRRKDYPRQTRARWKLRYQESFQR